MPAGEFRPGCKAVLARMLRAWLSTVRSDSTSVRDTSQLGTARCGQPGSRPPPRHCRPVRALRINLGKEVQVVGCWDQRAALPVQCLIDLGDTVTHPGVVHAKITSRPVVPGGIDYGVLAVGKGHGPGERVGKQVTLDCQVAAILNQKPPQVRRGHDEDSPPGRRPGGRPASGGAHGRRSPSTRASRRRGRPAALRPPSRPTTQAPRQCRGTSRPQSSTGCNWRGRRTTGSQLLLPVRLSMSTSLSFNLRP